MGEGGLFHELDAQVAVERFTYMAYWDILLLIWVCN